MNEPEIATSDYGAKLDGLARENPTETILWALGVGVALGCLVRVLQPRPAEYRAARLLDDLRGQLSGLAQPALRRVNSLAQNGASLAHNGAAYFSRRKLDRHLDGVSCKLRRLFR